jgi:hypothetical protein
VGVDPDFYDMVDDDIVAILLDACKPLFELVGGSADTNSKPSAVKPADLLMATAKLIIAAGYKMKEQARQEMAEEDLGGGMFDEDVKELRKAVVSYALPQVYDAEEQQVLDEQLAILELPDKSLTKYKTGTKLYSCDLADTGRGVKVRGTLEVRASVEQVRLHRGRYSQHAFLLDPLHRSSRTGWGTVSSTRGRIKPRKSSP